jgi:hypothetical protein
VIARLDPVARKVEQERMEMLEKLAARAHLQDEEKRELFERLQTQDRELSKARKELHFLRRKLHRAENLEDAKRGRLPPRVDHYLRRKVAPHMLVVVQADAPMRIINSEFREAVQDLPKGFIEELRGLDLIDTDGDLTLDGVELLREIVSEMS